MESLPRVACELVFEPADGERRAPKDLVGGTYRPHIVLEHGAPHEPLGVAFVNGPRTYVSGQTLRADLVCVYHPRVDYAALKPGAAFRVVEGASAVARGRVLAGPLAEPVSARTGKIVVGPPGAAS